MPHIGNKKVSFQLTDPIFALTEPIRKEFTTDSSCIVCDKDLKKNHKHACQFCGHKACEKCAFKLRVFAKQQAEDLPDLENMALSDIQKRCRMGRVCRVCDRKFFLRASFSKFATQLTYYISETQVVDEQNLQVQIELDEVNDQLEEVKNLIREEEQRYHTADVNQRMKLEEIQREQDDMRSEVDTLQQQLKYRTEQLSKAKRELTVVDIQKEQVSIALHRDTVRLKATTQKLELVQKDFSLRKSLIGGNAQRDRTPTNSKTFVV